MTLKNPRWQQGIEKLSPIIAEKLGFKDIPVECKLYKLLVYVTLPSTRTLRRRTEWWPR